MSLKRRQENFLSTHRRKRAAYCREKDLPRLTGLWPSEISTIDLKGRERIISILKNALRLERKRGKSGHWCYDLNRHLALKHALAEELASLKTIREKEKTRHWPKTSKTLRCKVKSRTERLRHATPPIRSQPALFLVLPTASSS